MKFLVVDSQEKVRKIISGFIESSVEESLVVEAESVASALEVAKQSTDIHTVFCTYTLTDGNGGKLYKGLKEISYSGRFVHISKEPPGNFSAFEGEPIVFFEIPKIMEPLKKYLGEVKSVSSGYNRVRITHLQKVGNISWDFYLKLSGEKYIKVIHKGSGFGEEELARYQKKKVEFLYINENDVADFFGQLSQQIDHLLEEGEGVSVDLQAFVSEVIHESVKTFGVTEQVQKMTQQAVKAAAETIKSDPSLKSVLEGFKIEEHSYLSSHSAALAHISCFIASKLSWGASDVAFKKLALAATFHDIAVENNDLAKAGENYNLTPEKTGCTDLQITEYKNHPALAAEVINSLSPNSFPPDVDSIVLQHHERPDGSGFPSGINATKISPLAAVFMIAHEAVHLAMEHGGEIDLDIFFTLLKEKFDSGSFKQILKELETAVR